MNKFVSVICFIAILYTVFSVPNHSLVEEGEYVDYRVYSDYSPNESEREYKAYGDEVFINCKANELESIILHSNGYTCIEARFGGGIEAARGCIDYLNAKVLSVDIIDGYTHFYCYTENFNQYVTVDGNTVNLHIAVYGGSVVAATPIIRSGY